MGLDIYLYHQSTAIREREDALEQEYNKRSDQIWEHSSKEYDDFTEEEKSEKTKKCKTLEAELGLGKWGESSTKMSIELASNIYPEHYWKIGYFRSSYNASGFNHIMKDLGFPNLYEIFQVSDEQMETGRIIPDWKAVLENLNQVIHNFEKFRETDVAKYEINEVSFYEHRKVISSGKEALDIFIKELEKHPLDERGFRSYSSKEGTFFLDGMKIFGVIKGKNIIGTDCTYLVTENKEKYEYEYKSLLIAKETVEYVLNSGCPEDYYFVWSG